MDIVKEHEEAEKSRSKFFENVFLLTTSKGAHLEESRLEEEKQRLEENSLEQEEEARRRAYSMFAPENRLEHWTEIQFERPNLHRKSSFHVGDEHLAPEDANFLMTRTKRSDSFMEKLKSNKKLQKSSHIFKLEFTIYSEKEVKIMMN